MATTAEVIRWLEKTKQKVKAQSSKAVVEGAGIIQKEVKANHRTHKFKALSRVTQAKKGHDWQLYDTGKMRDAVSISGVKKILGGVSVSVFTNDEKAIANEFGGFTPTGAVIPARPAWARACSDKGDDAQESMFEEIKKAISGK